MVISGTVIDIIRKNDFQKNSGGIRLREIWGEMLSFPESYDMKDGQFWDAGSMILIKILRNVWEKFRIEAILDSNPEN